MKAVRGSDERQCGRLLNFEDVELEFDQEIRAWFKLGAAFYNFPVDQNPDGLYARAKRMHARAAEEMVDRLYRLKDERRAARGAPVRSRVRRAAAV